MSKDPNNYPVFARSIELDAFVKLFSRNRPTSAENLRHNFFNQIPLKQTTPITFSPNAALNASFVTNHPKSGCQRKQRPSTATPRRYRIIKKATQTELGGNSTEEKKEMTAQNRHLYSVVNNKSTEAILNLGAKQPCQLLRQDAQSI